MSRKRTPRSEPKTASGIKPHKLSPRSLNQAYYIEAMRDNDIVLAYGPAGTGKTHLAAGMAVKLLATGGADKIVLTRPAIDSGASLGFLPGSLEDKITPYLVPLFDELAYYVEHKTLKTWLDIRVLELCSLSLMRGRTFVNSVVIFDEAQNATMPELRMALTRIGQGSKMILVGDPNQSDLPTHQQGGFARCIEKLRDLEGIGVVELTRDDIVRHKLILEIEQRLS